MTGVEWKPSRLVVLVGDRKLEVSHTRDVTRASGRGVDARHRREQPLHEETESGGPKQSCKGQYTVQSLTHVVLGQTTTAPLPIQARRSSACTIAGAKNGREKIKQL